MTFRTPLAGVAAAATLAAVVGCSPAAAPPDEDLSLTIGVGFLPVAGWDPAQANPALVSGILQGHALFDCLMLWDWESRSFQPWLATEANFADDMMSVELVLREDVVFHDGTPMTAAGVEKFLDNLLASETYPLGPTVRPYGPEATATGEYTLEISTTKPIDLYDLTMILTWTPVLSPAAVDDPERANAEPMGSGPYLIADTSPEVSMTFTRNPDYWNPDAFDFDTIEMRIFSDATGRFNALTSGQIDAAMVETAQVAEAEEAGISLFASGGVYNALFVQNPAESAAVPLRDRRVRQAIAHAFDQEAIAETLDLGHGTAGDQAFVPGQPEYIEGADDRYPYDPERARELLAEAGYPDGFDIVMPGGGGRLDPIVQQSLTDVGIRVTYEPYDPQAGGFLGYISGDWPLYLGERMTNRNNLRFLTEKFIDVGYIVTPTEEVVGLVNRIKGGDSAASAEASRELGALVLDEAWIIPISRPELFWGAAAGVEIRTNSIDELVRLVDFTATR